jgi:ABC-2 type transport system permease protein
VSVPAQPHAAPPSGAGRTGGGARIADRGYRRYSGPRRGVWGARSALFFAGIQRAMGLRRNVRHKLAPVLVAIAAYLPAVVFVGMGALLPRDIAEEVIPDYPDYYSFVSAAILLFVAVVVPDMLCTDRRTGLLGMYLAAPLDRIWSLITKFASVASLLAVVTLGPQLLLVIGRTLVDSGPGWPREGLALVARIVVTGLAVSMWYTTLGMVASALTDRRAFASATVVMAALVTSAITSALVGAIDAPQGLKLLDLLQLPFEVVQRIFGTWPINADNPTWAVVAAAFAWVAAGLGFVGYRYRRMVVTK